MIPCQKFLQLGLRWSLVLFASFFISPVFSQPEKTKKDSISGMFYSGYEGDGLSPAEKEEQKAVETWFKDAHNRRMELAAKLKTCPGGKEGDDCRKDYREQLREIDAAQKAKMEEMMRKFEIEKKYGLPEKLPENFDDYKPDYDKISFFVPKDYKEKPEYKNDARIREFYDQMRLEEQKLMDLYKKLDNCPEGKDGVSCKESYKKQIEEQKLLIQRKINAVIEEKKNHK